MSICKLLRLYTAAGPLSTQRVAIVGFSQGGALALYTVASSKDTFGGVVAMSGYLPKAGDVVATAAARQTPVLLCHGDADDVVPVAEAKKTLKALKKRVRHASCEGGGEDDGVEGKGGFKATLRVYRRLQHNINDNAASDVVHFLRESVPPNPDDDDFENW